MSVDVIGIGGGQSLPDLQGLAIEFERSIVFALLSEDPPNVALAVGDVVLLSGILRIKGEQFFVDIQSRAIVIQSLLIPVLDGEHRGDVLMGKG